MLSHQTIIFFFCFSEGHPGQEQTAGSCCAANKHCVTIEMWPYSHSMASRTIPFTLLRKPPKSARA